MIMVVINNIIKANVGCNEIEPNVVNYEMCQSRKKKVKQTNKTKQNKMVDTVRPLAFQSSFSVIS